MRRQYKNNALYAVTARLTLRRSAIYTRPITDPCPPVNRASRPHFPPTSTDSAHRFGHPSLTNTSRIIATPALILATTAPRSPLALVVSLRLHHFNYSPLMYHNLADHRSPPDTHRTPGPY